MTKIQWIGGKNNIEGIYFGTTKPKIKNILTTFVRWECQYLIEII